MAKMIDKQDFEGIKKRLEKADEARENSIQQSRKIVKLSKKVIYAVHRDEAASDALGELKKEMHKMNEAKEALGHSGSYRIAAQEYVEALAYYHFVKHKKLIAAEETGIDDDCYLLGVCDLVGELVRRAVNKVTHGKYEEALIIKEFVAELYEELMELEYHNNDLRRKIDGIKYELKKLEDLVLELKLKEKI